jgi:hypothetical protein
LIKTCHYDSFLPDGGKPEILPVFRFAIWPVMPNKAQFIFHIATFSGLLLKPLFRFHFDNTEMT